MSHNPRIEELFRQGIKCDPSQWDALGSHLPERQRRRLRELLETHRKLQQIADSPVDRSSTEEILDDAAGTHDRYDSTITCRPRSDDEYLPQRIADYRILNVIAVHGQGIVYRADHKRLNRQVVIKVGKSSTSDHTQQAIVQEGQSLAALDHPNIARIYDLRVEGGCPCLVMEYIEGRNLADLQAGVPMPWSEATGLVKTLAAAMQHAHDKGVIHRDLKPANVVIRASDNEPKIIDFGLARLRSAFDPEPEDSQYGGTVAFMAPEQAQWFLDKLQGQDTSDPTSQRTDIFALGAILFCLLTGKKLYAHPNARDSLEKAAACEFDRSALDGSASPQRLKDVCFKALSREPSDRFQSAADLADALTVPKQMPRWVVPVFSASVLLTVLLVYTLATQLSSTDKNGLGSANGKPVPPAGNGTTSDLKVIAEYQHFVNNDAGESTNAPLFQNDQIHENDAIRITAKFPHPRYCFFIALNPIGAVEPVQLCFPDPEVEASHPISELSYPPGAGRGFFFSDGSGQQVFLLVHSDRPLPAFGDWLESVGDVSRVTAETSGRWFWEEGQLLTVFRTKTRGKIADLPGAKPFTAICRRIESVSAHCAVHAVTFPINPRPSPK